MQGKLTTIKLAIAAVVLALGAAQANAALVSGTLNLAGNVSGLDGIGGSVVPNAQVTYLDFTDAAPPGPANTGDIISTGSNSGDFSGIGLGTAGVIKDISINPFSPVSCFIDISGFCFDLNSLNILVQDVTGLNIVFNVTVSGNGFDPTDGIVRFSSQGGTLSNVSFSANATTAVPVPGMLGLLGVSLVSLGLLTRRRRQMA